MSLKIIKKKPQTKPKFKGEGGTRSKQILKDCIIGPHGFVSASV